MAKQTFTSADVAEAPPASHTAVGNTVTRTNLWNPALWTPIPALDMRAGKAYILRAGGIIQTTGTPTLVVNPTFGQSGTPASNTALGATTTWTLGTIPASSPWYAEFVMVCRSIGVAAAGATVTGNGFIIVAGAAAAISQPVAMGASVPTTVDNTIAQGLCLDVTWGTANASNTITAQWSVLQSLN